MTEYKVLVAEGLSPEAMDVLKGEEGFAVELVAKVSEEELAKKIKGVHGVIVRSPQKLTRKVIESADQLKVIGRAGVGTDNIDLEAAKEKGVVVYNTPFANTISVAELTLGVILSLARNIPEADASMKQGKWERKRLAGIELSAKTLGLVGLGRIGGEVAKRARAFDMKVIGFDPYCTRERAEELGAELVEMDELLKKADFVSVHVPLVEKTRNLIGKQELEKMKDSAFLLNIARGGIVNEKELAEAIKNNGIAGAGIDSFEKEPPEFMELIELGKVVATPHLGASTKDAQERVGVEAAMEMINALKKGETKNALKL